MNPTTLSANLDVLWIAIAAILVIFMQAGFLLLDVGFSRTKNVGASVAKILVNFSVAGVVWWIVGFGIAFGGAGTIAGDSGFFFHVGQTISQNADGSSPFWTTLPLLGEGGTVTGSTAAFFLFQFAFCAVSLAIVWGATLERIRFGAYVIYGIVFAALIYPLGAHWIFGSGWLASNLGMQDYAGSTVVHLMGATGGLAALLLLGPRLGKYAKGRKPRAIPGHSMPFVGLSAIILWVGWFGFNGGSGLGLGSGEGATNHFAEVLLVTNLGAAGGVIAATLISYLWKRHVDVSVAANGAIGGLVAITAPSGYVEYWAAILIGLVAGGVVVAGVSLVDRKLDDPVGALSAHGLAGIWGTLSCGLFTSDRLAAFNATGEPGLFYGGGFHQLGVQALGVVVAFGLVFSLSFTTFFLIKKTIGLRVPEDDERAGLDISEHGMYGYPEQFIPEAEFVGSDAAARHQPAVLSPRLPQHETPAEPVAR